MSLGICDCAMFSIRLNERPMPTGSRDPDVLLEWILDSLGLLPRKNEHGTLQKLMIDAFLVDPLRGWDSDSLGEATGMSNTALHLQIRKLTQAGLITNKTKGKRHFHVLRGGSMASSVSMSLALATTTLGIRMSEVSQLVEESETRMEAPAEEDEILLSLKISEAGPRDDDEDAISSLAFDLGLSGDSFESGILARNVLTELCKSHHPITLMALSERVSESRGRVNTAVMRMRGAGLVEATPMIQRLSQDIFVGLNRQFSARGADWIMGRGGLSRIDDDVSAPLIRGLENGSLGMAEVEKALSSVPLDKQRVLLNLLGGRMPFGFRIAGRDGKALTERVSRLAERAMRRIGTVSVRLDEALSDSTD